MSDIYQSKHLDWNSLTLCIILFFHTLFAICIYIVLDGAFKLLNIENNSVLFFCAGFIAGLLMMQCYKQI